MTALNIQFSLFRHTDKVKFQVVVADPKADSYTAINPNGRLPTIDDPNTGLVLWESGAIIEYLIDTYDKEGKLVVEDGNDKWLLKQYLYFQMSGQVSLSQYLS